SAECVRKTGIENEFEQLWELYPRKEGKKNAYAAYKRARMRKDKPCSYEQVKKGIEAYSTRISGLEPKYVKQGQTYFNGECWNDEYIYDAKMPDPDVKKYEVMINRF
ncbi:MAG: hypothetical protein J6Y71_04525, partial [Ruminococcus sp.]|nr:hypothetical protein [Ruminococcus sp.]